MFFILTGCSKNAPFRAIETEDFRFVSATQNIRSGLFDRAIRDLNALIAARKTAPESHLLIGTLYLDHQNDPVLAIYHIRKYIEETSDAKGKAIAEQLINTAKKAFLQTLPAYSGTPQNEAELLDILRTLRDQNLALRQQLTQAKEALSESESKYRRLQQTTTSTVKSVEAHVPPPTSSQSYTHVRPCVHSVEKGETLLSIGERYYHNKNAWKRLLEANPGINPKKLKIGQKIVIP